jgi:hypothetical protein
VPTVMALAGATEAAATSADAAVNERRILRIETLLGLLTKLSSSCPYRPYNNVAWL